MNGLLKLAAAALLPVLCTVAFADDAPAVASQAVPALGYRVDPDFFTSHGHLGAGEASGVAAESDWLFNQPTDVAFGKHGEIYVSDGYGNSRIVKFDRDGKFIRAWGKYGTGPGEFNLPHSVVVDDQEHVYVADRENKRIQIFDADGKFLREWTGVGYPYGLFITPDQHVWMIDGGYDRLIELDRNGKILGALGDPGHAPGEFAWGHFLAIGKDRKIYVADVLNWRFQVFVPTTESGELAKYQPSKRMFWDRVQSSGWSTRTDVPKN